jgi:hypothetical protein
VEKLYPLELFTQGKTPLARLTTTSPSAKPSDSALSRKLVSYTVDRASLSMGSDVIDQNLLSQRKRDGRSLGRQLKMVYAPDSPAGARYEEN